MPSKYVLQQRGASGLENKAEIPALENGKIDMSWLPVVGESGAAIIARGSNANGEWVRWEDGTQVCYATTGDITPSWSGGTGVWLTNTGVIFPAAFISTPKVLSQMLDGLVGSRGTFVGLVNATTTSVTLYVRAVSSNNETIFRITYLAIGRWK